MEAVIVIGVIIALVIWCYIGKEFMNIAEMKGHHSSRYFWWTFLFSFVGMAMVIALPDRANTPTVVAAPTPALKADVVNDELPDL